MTTLLLILIIAACLIGLCVAVLLWVDSDPRPAYDDGADFKYVEPRAEDRNRGC